MIAVRHNKGTIEITFGDDRKEYIRNISQVDIVCSRISTYRIFSGEASFHYLTALVDLLRSAKMEMAEYLEKHNFKGIPDAPYTHC